MRLRHVKNSEISIYNSNCVIRNHKEYKGKWNQLFSNNNKIEIEIGMGKGDFLTSKAVDNPKINYIGIEKYASVLLKAVKKVEESKISNIKLIVMDAFEMSDTFDNEISKIYLNFSDPWPKNKHMDRRLTSKSFLEIYDNIFKDKCEIEMKTDNEELFKYSLSSFEKYGYNIKKISYDYNAKYKTEYEKKFISKGNKIKFVKVIK